MRHLLALAMMEAVACMPLSYADSRGQIRWRKGSDCQMSKRKKAREARRIKKLRRKQGRA